MRRFTGVLIACAAGLVLVGTAIAGFNANKSVHLTGEAEVPANASGAQGQASFKLSDDGTSVEYKLNVANIENVIVAHIHRAAAGANGPVGVFLYPSSTAGSSVPPGGGRIDGRIVTGSFDASNFIGPFAGLTVEQVWELIENGGAYVNVHTNDGVAPPNTGPGDIPGGEIRGDL
jgi:hypothetical protein